jgi:hypothetical protein
MTADDFRVQLEKEFDWRWSEVLELKNLIGQLKDDESQERQRRSLVVVLYAHFEGFCLFAMRHYVVAVNAAKTSCSEATSAVVAGAWTPQFIAVTTGDEKCKVFKSALPDDKYLHLHWRRRHFVEQVDEFLAQPVSVPDDVIDSDSNLSSIVLKRNLFVVGLDHNFVEPHAGDIDGLVGHRNRIAHGETRSGVKADVYEKYESAVWDVCYNLVDFVTAAFRDRAYQRKMPPSDYSI